MSTGNKAVLPRRSPGGVAGRCVIVSVRCTPTHGRMRGCMRVRHPHSRPPRSTGLRANQWPVSAHARGRGRRRRDMRGRWAACLVVAAALCSLGVPGHAFLLPTPAALHLRLPARAWVAAARAPRGMYACRRRRAQSAHGPARGALDMPLHAPRCLLRRHTCSFLRVLRCRTTEAARCIAVVTA